ncbi:hypothetical protein NEPAR03_2098 [Nematocida parisii]|nr:hypothetical protein NEPAR03_2098 [Nematocida parisii]
MDRVEYLIVLIMNLVMKRSSYIYKKLILATVCWISTQGVVEASDPSSLLLDRAAICAEEVNSPCILDTYCPAKIKSLNQNNNGTHANFMISDVNFDFIKKLYMLKDIIKQSYLIIYRKTPGKNLLVFQLDVDKQKEINENLKDFTSRIQQISIENKSFKNSTNKLMYYTEFRHLKTEEKYLLNTHAYAVDKSTIIDQYIKAHPNKSEIDETMHVWEDIQVIEICCEKMEFKMKSTEIDPKSRIYTYNEIGMSTLQVQIDNMPSVASSSGIVFRKKKVSNGNSSTENFDDKKYIEEAKKTRDNIYRQSMNLLSSQNGFDMQKIEMDGLDLNNPIIKNMKKNLDTAFNSISDQIKKKRGDNQEQILDNIKAVIYESLFMNFSDKNPILENDNQLENDKEILNQNNLKSIYAKIDEDNTALDPHIQKEWSFIYPENQSESLELAQSAMNHMENNDRFKYCSGNKISQVDIMFKKIREIIASDIKSSVRITMDVTTKKKTIKLEYKIFNQNEDSKNISNEYEMVLECRAIENIKLDDSSENLSTINHLKQTKKHEKSFLLITFTDTKEKDSKFHVNFNKPESNSIKIENISDNFTCIGNLGEIINKIEKSFVSEAFVCQAHLGLERRSNGSSPEPLTPRMSVSDNEETVSEEELDGWDDNACTSS